jgi:uncharacterized protein (TIGR00369 family)
MTERTRTYSWSEPVAYPTSGEPSGLAFLQAMIEGRLPQPPIAATLGFRLVEVGDGRAVFEGEASEFVLSPLGFVHGGLALTLVDSATGCAVQTRLPQGVGYTTLETKANFTRAIRSDTGTVRCVGRAIHIGRSTATADARVEDTSGRLLAHGTSTLLVLGPEHGDAP